MALNSLNLIFGPSMPPELEAVGLAFIAAPTFSPDSAIASLSADRYAKQNYDHKDDDLEVFTLGSLGSTLNVAFNIPAPTGILNAGNDGEASNISAVTLTDTTWNFPVLDKAIRVEGIHITKADTWCPIVLPGNIWRPGYTLVASGLEPATSWLRKAIPDDGEDHQLILIYAVPEYRYAVESSGGITFPPTGSFKEMQETVAALEPQKISYLGKLDILTEIVINGTTKFSGTFYEAESDTFVRAINKDLKQILLKDTVSPDDHIQIKYKSYNDYYVYSGYRDASGVWWPFDANPEYGHIIGDDQSGTNILSSDALLNQITLYAIPSAAIEMVFVPDPSSGSNLGTLNLKFYRACDYEETHFVRHIISNELTEAIDTRDGKTVINTWGYATFGRNYYDENNTLGGDIFNSIVPSMIPLGRFVLSAPASVKSVSIADIRQRGGGVPEDFTFTGVQADSDGLNKLRGFYDLGIWLGKAVKEGGVLEVQIDSSLLKTDENDTNPDTFLASEIYEIVRSTVCPGIDFEIRFIEM